MTTKIVIRTLDGMRLDGKYHHSNKLNAPAAIVLHPHHMYGGSMNNVVVNEIAKSFINAGASVLRFNFGTNSSSKRITQGGELLDATIALDWLQNNNPNASEYWVSGFGFGAWVAFNILMRSLGIDGFVAVAPPVNIYDFNCFIPCTPKGIVIHGEDDEITPEVAVRQFYQKFNKKNKSEMKYAPIKANHSFDGKLEELNTEITNYLGNVFSDRGGIA